MSSEFKGESKYAASREALLQKIRQERDERELGGLEWSERKGAPFQAALRGGLAVGAASIPHNIATRNIASDRGPIDKINKFKARNDIFEVLKHHGVDADTAASDADSLVKGVFDVSKKSADVITKAPLVYADDTLSEGIVSQGFRNFLGTGSYLIDESLDKIQQDFGKHISRGALPRDVLQDAGTGKLNKFWIAMKLSADDIGKSTSRLQYIPKLTRSEIRAVLPFAPFPAAVAAGAAALSVVKARRRLRSLRESVDSDDNLAPVNGSKPMPLSEVPMEITKKADARGRLIAQEMFSELEKISSAQANMEADAQGAETSSDASMENSAQNSADGAQEQERTETPAHGVVASRVEQLEDNKAQGIPVIQPPPGFVYQPELKAFVPDESDPGWMSEPQAQAANENAAHYEKGREDVVTDAVQAEEAEAEQAAVEQQQQEQAAAEQKAMQKQQAQAQAQAQKPVKVQESPKEKGVVIRIGK